MEFQDAVAPFSFQAETGAETPESWPGIPGAHVATFWPASPSAPSLFLPRKFGRTVGCLCSPFIWVCLSLAGITGGLLKPNECNIQRMASDQWNVSCSLSLAQSRGPLGLNIFFIHLQNTSQSTSSESWSRSLLSSLPFPSQWQSPDQLVHCRFAGGGEEKKRYYFGF